MTSFTSQRTNSQTAAYTALFVGILAGSFAAVFMRLAQTNGIPSLLIVPGRMGIAALILAPFVWRYYGAEMRQISRRDLLFTVMAGVALVIHFTMLLFALENTSVLLMQVIVGTGPIWTALLELFFLKTRLHRLVWAGLAVSMIGGVVVAFASGGATGDYTNPALGNVYAIISAVAAAAYITLGRKIRENVSNVPYVWTVFGSGAIISTFVLIMTGTPVTGYSGEGYFWILMIALIPQLMGHASFNFAAGYLTATIVSLSGQGVVFGAGIMAFLVFAQVPTVPEIMGSLIIIAGVLIAINGQSRRKRKS